MQSTFLKSTTAMLVALSVAAPSPILAQSDNAAPQAQEVTEELKKKLKEAEKEADETLSEAVEDEAPADQAEGSAPAEGSAEADANAQKVETEAEMDAEATAEAATDNPAENGEQRVESDTAEAARAEDEEELVPGPGARGDAAVNDAVPTDPVTGEATAEEGGQPETQDQPSTIQAESETPQQPAEEATGDTEQADAEAEAEAEAETQQAETADQTGEETEMQQAETADETDMQQADSADQTETQDQQSETAEAEELEAGPGARGDAAVNDAIATDPVTGEAPETMAAQAGDEEGELIEETVTDETARASDEEFETEVDGEATASASAEAVEEDSGLSTAEKIAVFGLGALAVGTLLNNGSRVVQNSGDRVVVEDNGTYRVLKNDDSLLRQPGADVKTYAFADGSTRTVVTNPDGTQVETIRSSDGRVLSRTRILANGEAVVLFDDTRSAQEVAVNELPQVTDRVEVNAARADEAALREALRANLARDPGRTFSLSQVRNIPEVRALAPEVQVNTVNFNTGSAVIRPEEAEELTALGSAMRQAIDENPREVFLVEGHTDAVGDPGYNLALSDRRAESLALALTEYFNVPPENLIVQGYGESDLKIATLEAERANRRAAVRRITPLLGD
ncbi:MAG: OmpA family protein [Pseudooceanicola sp.]